MFYIKLELRQSKNKIKFIKKSMSICKLIQNVYLKLKKKKRLICNLIENNPQRHFFFEILQLLDFLKD